MVFYVLNIFGIDQVQDDGRVHDQADTVKGHRDILVMFFENMPLLFLKFIELVYTGRTVSSYWLFSILSSISSINNKYYKAMNNIEEE